MLNVLNMYECQKLLVHAVEFKGEMTSFKIGPFLKPASEFRVCVCVCACVRACVQILIKLGWNCHPHYTVGFS